MNPGTDASVHEVTRFARGLHRFMTGLQRSSPVLLVLLGVAAIGLANASREATANVVPPSYFEHAALAETLKKLEEEAGIDSEPQAPR